MQLNHNNELQQQFLILDKLQFIINLHFAVAYGKRYIIQVIATKDVPRVNQQNIRRWRIN